MRQWFKPLTVLIIAIAAATAFSGCGRAAGVKVEVPKQMSGTVYTQTAMWEDKGKINGINYSVGRKIPVNTAVKIISMSSKEITFEEVAHPGIQLTYINVNKYTMRTSEELLPLYFGAKKVNLSKFTKNEQTFINDFAGFYKAGISKEALIVARGYPPKHATASLEYDTWKYWRNKWVYKTISFKDKKTYMLNGNPLEK